jgi:hypothetical protein
MHFYFRLGTVNAPTRRQRFCYKGGNCVAWEGGSVVVDGTETVCTSRGCEVVELDRAVSMGKYRVCFCIVF